MCALSVARKSEITEEYRKVLKDAKIAILSEFSGTTVGNIEEVRQKLREQKAQMLVIKNSLFKRCISDTKFKDLGEQVSGAVALVVSSEDIVGPAKVMDPYFSDDESRFNYRIAIGGVNYEPFSIAQIRALAKLPSREVLLGSLLGSLQAPIRNFMGALQAVSRDLVSVLSQLSKQSK